MLAGIVPQALPSAGAVENEGPLFLKPSAGRMIEKGLVVAGDVVGVINQIGGRMGFSPNLRWETVVPPDFLLS
jgi:hypothetical protein